MRSRGKSKVAKQEAQPTLLLISAGEEGGSHVRMLQQEFSSRLGCEVVSGTDSMSTWREQVDKLTLALTLTLTTDPNPGRNLCPHPNPHPHPHPHPHPPHPRPPHPHPTQVDAATKGVVLLQTKSVLAHPVRLLQLFEATNHGHPLVCVNVVGGGYDFGKVKPFLQNLAAELPNFATLRDELQKSSVSVGKLVRRLSKAVSDPNPNPGPNPNPNPSPNPNPGPNPDPNPNPNPNP